MHISFRHLTTKSLRLYRIRTLSCQSSQDKSSLEQPKAIGNMYAQPFDPRGNGKWQMAASSRKSENEKPA
jgi:hypothetical protein